MFSPEKMWRNIGSVHQKFSDDTLYFFTIQLQKYNFLSRKGTKSAREFFNERNQFSATFFREKKTFLAEKI